MSNTLAELMAMGPRVERRGDRTDALILLHEILGELSALHEHMVNARAEAVACAGEMLEDSDLGYDNYDEAENYGAYTALNDALIRMGFKGDAEVQE